MKWTLIAAIMALALAKSDAPAQDVTAQARAALAPTGKLRVVLLPLPHLAVRDQSTGQFAGVTVDLGRELGRRLGVPVEFAAAGSNLLAAAQIKDGLADLTFLVALPEVGAQIDFGPPYIEYETSFLVHADAMVRGIDDIDIPGFRILVPESGASMMKLKQALKNVTLIGMPIALGSAQRVVDMLRSLEADAYSNLSHLLSLTQANLPDWRVVPGSYMMTTFSVGYAKDRPAAVGYIREFIAAVKASGFIQQSIERANLKGAAVPE